MRIVAGHLKGRRLKTPPHTRPTADKVREAVFSILGDVSGLRVLDLFAGSGAMGIEALSRGASDAVFVENRKQAVDVIRANLRALGLSAAVVRADALSFVKRASGAEGYGLVLIDPPYDSAPDLAGALAECLPPVLDADALIVTESNKRAPLELPFPCLRERSYGDTRITVHRGP